MLTGTASHQAVAEAPPAVPELSTNSEARGLVLMTPSEVRKVYNGEAPLRQIRLEPDKSLFVRKPSRLSGLSFAAVLDRLAADTGQSPEALFATWWRALRAGTSAVDGTPCSTDPIATPTLNPYELLCDPALAGLADASPLPGGAAQFTVIAAVNRIDLAQPRYDCGEYRLVIALKDTLEIKELYLNFEATVLNPLIGDESFCKAIQQFWANLSELDDETIAERLARFFLGWGRLTDDGQILDDTPDAGAGYAWRPVITAQALGGDSDGRRAGRIAVNSLTETQLWVLREFKVRPGGVVQVPLDGTPDPGTLASGTPWLEDAKASLYAQRDALLTRDVFKFALNWPDGMYANQQVTEKERGTASKNPYRLLDPALEAYLDTIGSTEGLNAFSLRKRITLQSCAGCHTFSNNVEMGFDNVGKWPRSQRFTHICFETPLAGEPADDGQYKLSPLVEFLLRKRFSRMLNVLGAKANYVAPVIVNCQMNRG
jgi:hypothetical protein